MEEIKSIKWEDFATSTGDEICKDICKKTTVYRYLKYLIPLVGIPVGISIGNGVSNSTSSKVLAAIAAVTMSKIAVRIVRKYGKEKIKKKIGLEDNEDDKFLNFDIREKNKYGEEIIIGIKAKDILNLAIIAGSDHQLLKNMIMQMVESKRPKKTEEKEPSALLVDTITKEEYNENKTIFAKIIENFDWPKINDFLSKVSVRLLPVPSPIKILINKIISVISKRLSDNKKDTKDGKKDGMIDGVPVDVHIILKNITGDNTELYNSLKEIYNERQEELKPHIEYLNQSFEDKTLKQKIADLLRKNNWLMKVWFIKDYVTKQALALPTEIQTDLYSPVYNKYGEIIEYEAKKQFKEELSIRSKYPSIILDEHGNIIRVYSKDREER